MSVSAKASELNNHRILRIVIVQRDHHHFLFATNDSTSTRLPGRLFGGLPLNRLGKTVFAGYRVHRWLICSVLIGSFLACSVRLACLMLLACSTLPICSLLLICLICLMIRSFRFAVDYCAAQIGRLLNDFR